MEEKLYCDDIDLEDKILKYAKSKDQDYKLVHIDLVKTGLACNCVCPRCLQPVIAKNTGKKYDHFFCHEKGADCVGAHETVMHLLAKEILSEEKCICLPKHDKFPTGQLTFDRVEVEFHDKDTNLRPDCACFYGDKVLWVEFKRTHQVDKHKADKIVSKGVECIEIDLNKIIEDKDRLKDYLINKSENRRWIYNKRMTAKESEYNPERKRKESSYVAFSNYQYGIFAIDETGRLCCLRNQGEVDFNEHQYFCPACKKELTLKVLDREYLVFEHVDKDQICNWEMYIHHSAQLAALRYFNTNPRFPIEAEIIKVCDKYYQCPIKESSKCNKSVLERFEIKSCGYDTCAINVLVNEVEKINADLVISKSDNSDDRFIINFRTGDYAEDIPDDNFKYIEIDVETEAAVYNIMRSGLSFCYINHNNLLFEESVSISELKHKVIRFILHNSGKYFVNREDCDVIFDSKKPSTKVEFYINETAFLDDNSIRPFMINHCLEKAYKVFKCDSCLNFSPINRLCKRYKTVNTPKNPMKGDFFECNEYYIYDYRLKEMYNYIRPQVDIYEK